MQSLLSVAAEPQPTVTGAKGPDFVARPDRYAFFLFGPRFFPLSERTFRFALHFLHSGAVVNQKGRSDTRRTPFDRKPE